MTKEEILAMEVGADLDVAVAQTVMGWTFHKETPKWGWWDGKHYMANSWWSPSRDISAAWQVVEKLCNWDVDDNMLILKGQAPDLEPKDEDGKVGWWEAKINGEWGKVMAEGKTAPEAICKAALLAKLGGSESGG